MIDTGTDLCVFPHKYLPGPRQRSEYQLFAANNTVIPIYGWTPLSLNLGLRLSFPWRFVIADTQVPIIGNFLSHYELLVNCRNNRLIDTTTSLAIPGHTAPPFIHSVKTLAADVQLDSLLREFPELTTPAGINRRIHHNTVHDIKTTPGSPVACRLRRLDPRRLSIAKGEFSAMLHDGSARRVNGPWSSALHLVPKKNYGWRTCGDYRALNSRTIPDRYPVPHILDYSHSLTACNIVSKIDLVRAYQKIPVHPDDIQKQPLPLRSGSLSSRICPSD